MSKVLTGRIIAPFDKERKLGRNNGPHSDQDWADAKDDMAQDGYNPTDDMVDDYLNDPTPYDPPDNND